MKKNVFLKVCAVIALAVSIFALSLVSYSWYSSNRNADNYQLPVITDEASGISCGDYLIYVKHMRNDTGNLLGEPEYEIFNSLDDVSLNFYDSVFGRNEDTPIIIRIPISLSSAEDGSLNLAIDRRNVGALDGKTDDYGLKATETFSQSATAEDPQEYSIETGLIVNYLSNISTYKTGIVPSLNSTEPNNAKAIYDGAHTALSSIRSQAFAFQSRSGKVYTVTKTTNAVELNAVYAAGDIAIDPDTDANTLYLYVEIDYDPYLIAAYIQNHNQSFKVGKLGNAELLRFIGDLNTITITVG